MEIWKFGNFYKELKFKIEGFSQRFIFENRSSIKFDWKVKTVLYFLSIGSIGSIESIESIDSIESIGLNRLYWTFKRFSKFLLLFAIIFSQQFWSLYFFFLFLHSIKFIKIIMGMLWTSQNCIKDDPFYCFLRIAKIKFFLRILQIFKKGI